MGVDVTENRDQQQRVYLFICFGLVGACFSHEFLTCSSAASSSSSRVWQREQAPERRMQISIQCMVTPWWSGPGLFQPRPLLQAGGSPATGSTDEGGDLLPLLTQSWMISYLHPAPAPSLSLQNLLSHSLFTIRVSMPRNGASLMDELLTVAWWNWNNSPFQSIYNHISNNTI